MMRERILCLSCTTAMTLACPVASAVEKAAAYDNSPALETVTITGTRLLMALPQLSTHVTVTDQETLSRLNKVSVTDVLRSVPGLQVSQQGGPAGVTNVYIRGGEPNFGVVMLDGVQVNDPTSSTGGSFDFSSIDVASIERIETVRGPQSAIYGTDALAGAINIVTRQGSPDVENTLSWGMGADGYHHLGYQLTGSSQEQWDYALGVYRKDYGQPVHGSKKELTTVTGKTIHALGEATRAEATAYFSTAERESFPQDSGGPEFAVARLLDVADSDDLALSAALSHQFSNAWLSLVRGSWYRHTDDSSSPGIYPFFEVPPTFTRIDFRRINVSWVNALALTRQVAASVGADLKSERGDSEGYVDFSGAHVPTDFALDRRTFGLFAELQADLDSGVSLNLSARHDDPAAAGAETTYKIGARYAATSGTTFRANWGQGFKLPSFFALGHALVGNPTLKPERSESYDVGVTQRIAASGASLTLNLFHNEFQDLIDFDAEAFTNVNRGQVETKGAELRIDYAVRPGMEMAAYATYLDIDVAEAGVKLRGRPPWKAGVQAHYLLPRGIAFNLDYQWVGEVHEASRHTGASVLSTLEPYQRVDVNLSWQPSPNLQLQLAVDNLLDEDYAEAVGFPAAGMQPRLSMRYRL